MEPDIDGNLSQLLKTRTELDSAIAERKKQNKKIKDLEGAIVKIYRMIEENIQNRESKNKPVVKKPLDTQVKDEEPPSPWQSEA